MSSPVQSTIHLSPPNPTTTTNPTQPAYILYFITGNPGLIEYYRIFLTHLYGLLFQESPSANSHIFGRSLSGFETTPPSPSPKPEPTPPFGLRDQIMHSEAVLEALVTQVQKDSGARDIRVILIGHSVGAYILLEVLRRQREKSNGVRIIGGICLFPTITHIAKSPSGRKSSWLLNLHPFARTAAIAARILTYPLPLPLLTPFLTKLLSFPRPAARITAAFIKSPHGVHQALHMARDEMLQITEDAWSDEVWGAAHPSGHEHARPVLRFLFAERDHWVADETRDELVRGRGRVVDGLLDGREEEGEVEEWKPLMEIDEDEGWPHGFCIRHSVPVAERVFGYVQHIIEIDSARE
ncbi:hypothetical protein K458DRAFT_311304 [Lentithecium fluviatile CBS 122367]|uniref:Uncharacterized protein n=1 Tax=Lentithecium fluviatile CBS 122367 TaxID=1168545 RepID=A0A6G1IR72_9PLEO|nr:hypothetical protein K458DRAFT_311304 [Lentithecium fluviatile CBS 122367]